MRHWERKLALLFLAGMAVMGLAALPSTVGTGSSEAVQSSMQNCPEAGKWSIAVWNGPPDIPIADALETCASVEVEAAYSINLETQIWSRYFAGRPEMSTLTAVDEMQGVLALGGAARSMILQLGNRLPETALETKRSNELEDNRIAVLRDGLWEDVASAWEPYLDRQVQDLGVKRLRLSVQHLDGSRVNWSKPELAIDPGYDDLITHLAQSGITITFVLVFWDTANHPEGWGEISSRFKTEEEIQRYLEFVRFIVHHFKDRVRYFEIWNEPDNDAIPVQYIEVADYINLVKRTVPVIRQEYPQARIVVGSTAYLLHAKHYDYLFSIIRSEIMPLVDVVASHPMYATSPQYEAHREYYYEYPGIVQDIKDTASAHGFEGEYEADEITWRVPETELEDFPLPNVYSDTVAAKYFARGIVMHLGMDVTVGNVQPTDEQPSSRLVLGNLCSVMAGNKPSDLAAQVQSEATNIKSYGFSLPNGDRLFALWTDGVAVDDDRGVDVTLTFTGFSDKKAIGIDVLNGFEQQLITDVQGGDLVVRDLLVKDYPIILRLTPAEAP